MEPENNIISCVVSYEPFYGQTKALNAINLSIPVGKTIVLLGPSGYGKPTRIINGLIQPNNKCRLRNRIS